MRFGTAFSNVNGTFWVQASARSTHAELHFCCCSRYLLVVLPKTVSANTAPPDQEPGHPMSNAEYARLIDRIEADLVQWEPVFLCFGKLIRERAIPRIPLVSESNKTKICALGDWECQDICRTREEQAHRLRRTLAGPVYRESEWAIL